MPISCTRSTRVAASIESRASTTAGSNGVPRQRLIFASADRLQFVRVEATGFQQHPIGHSDLADVVKQWSLT